MLVESERAAFPPNLPAAWILLRHKITRFDEVYAVAEFGLAGDRYLDLSEYESFKGINVWTEHVARQFKKPAVRWLPLAGLAIVSFLVIGMIRLPRRFSG
jgi:hypothetical protein